MVIFTIICMFFMFYLWAKLGLIWAFAIMIAIPLLIFFGVAKLDVMDKKKKQRMLEDDSVSEEVKEQIRTVQHLEREKLTKQAKAVKVSNDMKYIGGHEEYGNMKKGQLYLYDDRVDFYSSEIFIDDVERNTPLFSIQMNEISAIAYDLSENITLPRFIMLGLASFVFKKQTYYLIIKYINKAGIENEVVFETGDIKDQKLFNVLNISRNKCKLYPNKNLN